MGIGGELEFARVGLGAIAAALIASAGNAHNDVCDLEVDRVNRPDRPLPRGEVSPSAAVVFAFLLAAGGIIIGACLGIVPLVITAAAAVMLFVYNVRLKMTILRGNITVSLLTALTFILGAVLAGKPEGGLVPAVFSLLFHFSRELVKDMEDFAGDTARPGATFVLRYGLNRSAVTAAAILSLLFFIVPIPFFANLYNINYLIVSALGVETVLAWTVYRLLRSRGVELRRLSSALKFGMVMGLIALYTGG